MSERAEVSGSAFWGDVDDAEALRRYRELLGAVADGIYRLDADGRFVAVDDGVVELAGYAREELLGEHVSLLVDDGSATEQLLAESPDRSGPLKFPVRTAEGDRIRCEIRTTRLEADGTVQGTVGVVREVADRGRRDRPPGESERTSGESERPADDPDQPSGESDRPSDEPDRSRGESDRQVDREPTTEPERELREARARLDVAASAGSVGTWTWDVRENVATADEYFAESYGLDPAAAAAGVPIEEFLAPVHEADRERVRNRLDEAVEETGAFEAEYRVTTGDGDVRRVASRGDVEYEDGEPRRMHGATVDVTERREAEAELERVTAEAEQQQRLYETIISSTPDLVYAFDLDYRFTFANDAVLEMWGQTREESLGKTLREIGYEDWHAEMHEREIDEVVETKEPIRGEVAFPHAEHGERIYEYIFAPVLDDDGEVEAIAGTTRDVTERKETEEALKESEERFRALVTASSDVVYRMSPDWSEMHELEGKEFLADTDESTSDWVDKYIHPDDRPRVMDAIDEAIRTKSIFELEHRVEQDDGSVGWTFSRAVPMLNEDGEIDEWIGMASDITERKRRERELEESERRYRTLAENFPNGAVGVYDHDLRFTLTEGSVLGDTLPSAEHLEGERIPELFPPEVVADLEPMFRAAVEEGATRNTTTEFDGRHWQVWAAPLRDADGEIFAGLSLAQDITEQVERERELERALSLLDRTQRIADVGGWEIDVDTKDVFWTDHIFDLLEVPGDEEPPLDEALDMYHEEDKPIVVDAVENALDSGEPFDVEVRLRTAASDDVRWLRLQGVPETEDGDVVSLRGAAQDITEQVERERELEERTERLDEFASMLAHELRNPVTIGQIYSQQLPDDADAVAVEYVTEAFDRIEDMIDVMLVLTRGHEAVGERTPVDLADAAREAWDDVDAPDATLEVGVDRTVQADETYVQHLFRNLLENAVEHGSTSRQPTADDAVEHGSTSNRPSADDAVEHGGDDVTVTVGELPDGFYVADDGPGIPPEDREAVFRPGYTTAADQEGTGLGLAFVRQLADVYDWTCTVTESAAGGARFEFANTDEDSQRT